MDDFIVTVKGEPGESSTYRKSRYSKLQRLIWDHVRGHFTLNFGSDQNVPVHSANLWVNAEYPEVCF